MIESLLRTLSLQPKEITVFMTTLELGSQPASHIARVCELPRNTVRSILDNLVKRGIMVKTRRGNTQYYAVEKKENIIKQLKFRRIRVEEEIDRQIELLEQCGDELDGRQYAKSRPKITFYEGVAGIEKVYEDTLTAKDGLRSWASCDDLLEALPEYFHTYFKRRAKKGIAMRSIHPDTPSAQEIMSRNEAENREGKLVPADKYHWTPEIQIYNDKINIVSWKEKLGIIIESQEIADAFGEIFEMCFENIED